MKDTRKKNSNWSIEPGASGQFSFDAAHLAVLMDIRDELQAIRRLVECHRIPRALDAIGRIDRRMQNRGLLVDGRKRK